MSSTVFLIFAVGIGLAALIFAMHKAVEAILMRPPIKLRVNEYRVVFAQRGWSYVAASIEQESIVGFKSLRVWRTIHCQARRFGDKPWGYSMRELSELPANKLEQLAGKLVSDYLTTVRSSTAATAACPN